MKLNLSKKILISVTIVSMILIFSTNSFAMEGLNVSDEEEIYSSEEMQKINSEYQSKEEAIAESQDLKDEELPPMSRAALPTSSSNATPITGNTPYFTGSYFLTAGSAGYVKLTPTQNYYVSIYTTGSTDTKLEVYSNLSCTNLITSNDDGGHGTNAKLYFYANSGNTYYIKLKGYSTSTSGNYLLVLQRGQPTSRSERGDMFTTYNSSAYQQNNNCYTYALTYYFNPVTGYKYATKGQNPGQMSGNSIGISDLVNATTTKTKFEAAMTKDFNYFGGKWNEISASDQPQPGYFKVALVLAPGEDYHWYRQLSNGTWAHKPGNTKAVDYDSSNYLIYQPQSCARNHLYNYTEFIAFYEFKIPPSISPKELPIENEDTIYPIIYDLTMEDILSLTSETSFNNAIAVLGQPHGFRGSGMIGDNYTLLDGTQITVYYTNGTIDQIRSYHEDGSFDILVQ